MTLETKHTNRLKKNSPHPKNAMPSKWQTPHTKKNRTTTEKKQATQPSTSNAKPTVSTKTEKRKASHFPSSIYMANPSRQKDLTSGLAALSA